MRKQAQQKLILFRELRILQKHFEIFPRKYNLEIKLPLLIWADEN